MKHPITIGGVLIVLSILSAMAASSIAGACLSILFGALAFFLLIGGVVVTAVGVAQVLGWPK